MSNDALVTSSAVKEKAIETVAKFLARCGVEVYETRSGNVVTLVLTIPPDSVDPHGDRLGLVRGEKTT